MKVLAAVATHRYTGGVAQRQHQKMGPKLLVAQGDTEFGRLDNYCIGRSRYAVGMGQY